MGSAQSKELRQTELSLRKDLRDLEQARRREPNRYSQYVIEQNMVKLRQSIEDLERKRKRPF